MRAGLAAMFAATLLAANPALAQGTEAVSAPPQQWSFDGVFGTYDRAALQRGFQVYNDVCSNCHSMKELYYRNLIGGNASGGAGGTGIGLTAEQVAAIAATKTITGGTDDSGQPVERFALPADHFRTAFPNDKAARAANGGALPPDQSLIIKARDDGPNYVYALLNGYQDPPAGLNVPPGQYYNEYFPGHLLAMPPPLHDDQVTYADGTKATVPQMSRDVVQFLTWASSPELETRHRMGVKIILFLCLMTGLTVAVKRRIWKDAH